MEISISSLLKDLPERPIEPRSAALPRYLNNNETHEHLSGRRISLSVLKVELERLSLVWARVQTDRRRDAVYDFLETAYGVVHKFKRNGMGVTFLRKLYRLDATLTRIREPYAAVIHHGTGYDLDSRTRSKWSLLLRYVEKKKKAHEPFDRFVRGRGGINGCVSRHRKGI